ncbi:hypothetical protein LTR78_000825 [Recurvomyces mirabilis]|uniref:Uncharacterized protein n=1 Tax=Recurvomyces mirabilis TaxID=574656 RepID=A0AAE0WWJ7_9PEZI|nr:hypothetical protein LTR78_000825 [Recurvomyces mirabilis]KAK5158794.1 hypothetical protein LTS14_002902 [Recurvomyces mirabilis]
MSSYFSLPSFARAKKNQEQLEKTNPQKPVLNDDDEKFFDKHIESGEAKAKTEEATSTEVTEGGEEKEILQEETKEAGTDASQVTLPEEQPEKPQTTTSEPAKGDNDKSNEVARAPKEEIAAEDPPEQAPAEKITAEDPPEQAPAEDITAEDPPEQAPDDAAVTSAASAAKKPKKDKGFELPSQEEAEAATRGIGTDDAPKDAKAEGEAGEKRTWASYLPTMSTASKKDQGEPQKDTESKSTDEKAASEQTTEGKSRTWTEYASSTYSALPSVSSITPSWTSKDKDSKVEPVYKEDGTIDEEKTKEKQEREMSVLLDHLNLSSINNRVFAFSGETQKIYERFAQVLKDTMNGAPTAYEDMDKLMKDAGPQLEKQFQSMPPFVQTLVKSLPAKLGTTLGPELLAAASEKPGADMKTKMAKASKQSSGGQEFSTADASTSKTKEKEGEPKKKRKIPGLKGLVSEQGAVASILRSVVSFLKVRFPFLASMTNVVMSLAVFILMFVFWYSHKRGKEVRLAREAAAQNGDGAPEIVEDEDGELEVEVTDEEEGGEEEESIEKDVAAAVAEAQSTEKQDDSAEAVEEKTEKAADEAVKDGPVESAAKQEDSAEAVEEKAEKAEKTTEDAGKDAPVESIAKQEDSAEALEEKSAKTSSG